MSLNITMLIGVAILIVVPLWVIMTYNKLVTMKNSIENAWSQIDVQLQRRFDLIPNLVETVKGYAAHEKEVFENVAKARSAMMNAQTIEQKGQAQNQITEALKTLFAVAESYPELKANENFRMLQEELTGTESKIAHYRQFYNDEVMGYNTKLETFPSSFIAGMFNFKQKDYFPMEDAARGPVKVQF